MSLVSRWVLIGVVLALAGVLFLHTGLARQAFFALFAYVKQVDVVSPNLIREPPSDSPYQRWLEQAREDLPVLDTLVIEDVATQPLAPWPAMGEGASGLYLRFSDYQMSDGRLLELPAGARGAPQRHLFEKAMYIIAGSGRTEFTPEGADPVTVAWRAGDLLAVPLNVRHRHAADAGGPARWLAVTSFPFMLNAVDNERFLVANSFLFSERYGGEPGFFDPPEGAAELLREAAYVPDLGGASTVPFEYRGPGNRTARWDMAGNSMLSVHISEFPPGRYRKAHRHSSDAFILLLEGEGFSVAWPEAAWHRHQRIEWRRGTLFVPPTLWYHQHLNTGNGPARYLAINMPELTRNLGLRFSDQLEVDQPEVVAAWRAARGGD